MRTFSVTNFSSYEPYVIRALSDTNLCIRTFAYELFPYEHFVYEPWSGKQLIDSRIVLQLRRQWPDMFFLLAVLGRCVPTLGLHQAVNGTLVDSNNKTMGDLTLDKILDACKNLGAVLKLKGVRRKGTLLFVDCTFLIICVEMYLTVTYSMPEIFH